MTDSPLPIDATKNNPLIGTENLLHSPEVSTPSSDSACALLQADYLNSVWPNLTPSQGSYYHKETSAYGSFVGISAVLKLGKPSEDPKRIGDFSPAALARPRLPNSPDPRLNSLDGFSEYLGGNSLGHHEVDAGLTWSVTRDKHGAVDYKHKAWRPFWRDESWSNAAPARDNYWYPGEVVKISLTEVANSKLQLSIADLNSGRRHSKSFITTFNAVGFNDQNAASFKRVDAIDQLHREGKTVVPTTASLRNIEWRSTSLLAKVCDKFQLEIPMSPDLSRVIEPLPDHVSVKASPAQSAIGAERVAIFGRLP